MTVSANDYGRIIVEIGARDVVTCMLLVLGIASVLASICFSQFVLAFIGLGLVFWGRFFFI